jgi:actin-like ATPase involved in cell morphogenesis
MTRPGDAWELGIDFGTSYTVAAIASSDGVAVLDIESNGQSRMPSSVFYTESGEILVGSAAQHQSAFAPERFEATPKRSITDGEIFLGDEMVAVTTLVAAVLRKAYTEATRRRGETMPRVVRLTHPAEWGAARLDLLREAAARADLPEVVLVPEPVAAAIWIAGAVTRPGERIAVYDFGGGTFDAAVLRRTNDGFDVAGPPAGRDPLGGEDIDRRIVDYIGSVLSGDSPDEWSKLVNPQDVTWRRCAIALRMEVQRAKETLSEVTACQLWIPGLERELQLTRAELEELISDDLDECTETLMTAMSDAAVTPEQLAGVYLVGGSSRIPVVAEKLWRRLGITPSVQDSPKSVVALGAARWTDLGTHVPVQPPPSERTVVTVIDPEPELSIVRTDLHGQLVLPPSLRLTLPPGMEPWRAGVSTYQSVDRVSGGVPATLRVRDEPARDSDVAGLAARAGAVRASRSRTFVDHGTRPLTVFGALGLERSFTISPRGVPVRMLERYAVAQDRALVMAFPAEIATLADHVHPAGWPALGVLRAPAVMPRPPGWVTSEEIHVVGGDGARVARAERVELPDEPEEAWRWHQLERLLQELPGAGMAGRSAGRIMGSMPGEIVTVQWQGANGVMLTKLGTATNDGHGFVLTLSLPLERQSEFPIFARLVSVDRRPQT